MSFYLRWTGRLGPKCFYLERQVRGGALKPSDGTQAYESAIGAFSARDRFGPSDWDVVEVVYALRFYDSKGKAVEGAAYRGGRGGMYPRAEAAVFDTVAACRASCPDILYPNEHCPSGYRVVRLTKKVKS